MRPPHRSSPETRVQFRAVDWAAKTVPLSSNILKLTDDGGCAPRVKSQVPSCWCTRIFVSPEELFANVGAAGVQPAPAQAVIAETLEVLAKLPDKETERWLSQLGTAQGRLSRSSTRAPMMKAMQKAATRGTKMNSTRRRESGTARMEPCYRTTLTVCRESGRTEIAD
jgi:hypothetical protein